MLGGFSAIKSMPLILPYMAIHIPSLQAAYRSKKSTHDECPVQDVGIKKIVGELKGLTAVWTLKSTRISVPQIYRSQESRSGILEPQKTPRFEGHVTVQTRITRNDTQGFKHAAAQRGQGFSGEADDLDDFNHPCLIQPAVVK